MKLVAQLSINIAIVESHLLHAIFVDCLTLLLVCKKKQKRKHSGFRTDMYEFMYIG